MKAGKEDKLLEIISKFSKFWGTISICKNKYGS